MIITSQILATGHYTEIQHDNITLIVRTDHGYPAELAQEAVEMRQKAARLTRNADMIRDALRQMGVMPGRED